MDDDFRHVIQEDYHGDHTAFLAGLAKRGQTEAAFRAGAMVGARLVWQQPFKYQSAKEVADAAWEESLPAIKSAIAKQFPGETNLWR